MPENKTYTPEFRVAAQDRRGWPDPFTSAQTARACEAGMLRVQLLLEQAD